MIESTLPADSRLASDGDAFLIAGQDIEAPACQPGAKFISKSLHHAIAQRTEDGKPARLAIT